MPPWDERAGVEGGVGAKGFRERSVTPSDNLAYTWVEVYENWFCSALNQRPPHLSSLFLLSPWSAVVVIDRGELCRVYVAL